MSLPDVFFCFCDERSSFVLGYYVIIVVIVLGSVVSLFIFFRNDFLAQF